jgi:hypothetical protein
MTKTQESIDHLTLQIGGLLLQAEASEAIARHFRPRFNACWTQRPNGSLDELVDADLAVLLRPFVVDEENRATHLRREAEQLSNAVRQLRARRRSLAGRRRQGALTER